MSGCGSSGSGLSVTLTARMRANPHTTTGHPANPPPSIAIDGRLKLMAGRTIQRRPSSHALRIPSTTHSAPSDDIKPPIQYHHSAPPATSRQPTTVNPAPPAQHRQSTAQPTQLR